jgi:RNA polymerase sigma-70 factor (sigma-E family)
VGLDKERLSVDCPEEFIEFAGAEAARLRRTAFLLCGDWHTAQDLTQTTLASVFVAWHRIERREGVHAYAHRTLVNSYLALRRKRSSTELLATGVPDRGTRPGTTELRLVLLKALAALSPRARAVVVLRYWEDRSIDQVAAMLGCSAGNVKSMSSRALERLRTDLGESLIELCSSD